MGFEQMLGGAQTTNRIELGSVTLTKTGAVTSVQSNLTKSPFEAQSAFG